MPSQAKSEYASCGCHQPAQGHSFGDDLVCGNDDRCQQTWAGQQEEPTECSFPRDSAASPDTVHWRFGLPIRRSGASK